jgi:hypothetical protein
MKLSRTDRESGGAYRSTESRVCPLQIDQSERRTISA